MWTEVAESVAGFHVSSIFCFQKMDLSFFCYFARILSARKPSFSFSHFQLCFPNGCFSRVTASLDLFHPFLFFSFLCGLSFLKMKHRLPTSGTSTIFMLSQTASTHSFSWSDWGLFYAFIFFFLPSCVYTCRSSLSSSHLLGNLLHCLSSPTVRFLPSCL